MHKIVVIMLSRVLNLMVGSTPIKEKSEDIPPEGMTLILNGLDHQ